MSETFVNPANKPLSAQNTKEAPGQPSPSGSLTEKASAVAHGMTDQASELAQNAMSQVKEQAAELTDSAKGLASDTAKSYAAR